MGFGISSTKPPTATSCSWLRNRSPGKTSAKALGATTSLNVGQAPRTPITQLEMRNSAQSSSRYFARNQPTSGRISALATTQQSFPRIPKRHFPPIHISHIERNGFRLNLIAPTCCPYHSSSTDPNSTHPVVHPLLDNTHNRYFVNCFNEVTMRSNGFLLPKSLSRKSESELTPL